MTRVASCFLLCATALVLAGCDARAGAPHAHPDAESVEPLQPGAVVPSVGVRDVAGRTVDLASLVRDRGALLVFYRGGW